MNIQQLADNFDKKMDGIESNINAIHGNIKSIQECLGGNPELATKGLVKDHETLKKDYYHTKKEVNRLTWFSGLVATAFSSILAYLGLK